MLRRLLLALLLLAVFPAAVKADTIPPEGLSFGPIMPSFPLPGGAQDAAMVNVRLKVFATPPGFTINGVPFCRCYIYQVEMWQFPVFPKDFLGGFTISSCGFPFAAERPV